MPVLCFEVRVAISIRNTPACESSGVMRYGGYEAADHRHHV
jgi:hypothetical protein